MRKRNFVATKNCQFSAFTSENQNFPLEYVRALRLTHKTQKKHVTEYLVSR